MQCDTPVAGARLERRQYETDLLAIGETYNVVDEVSEGEGRGKEGKCGGGGFLSGMGAVSNVPAAKQIVWALAGAPHESSLLS